MFLFKKKTPKYLNQGTYGCIYSPPFDCSDQVDYKSTNVGKVFKKPNNGEENLTKFVEKVDPDSLFTVKYRGSCKVKEQIVGQCGFSKNTQQLIYENGGLDLLQIAGSNKHNVALFLKMFRSLLPVLQGIQKLNIDENILHHDIKPANITFKKSKMFLIDFGIAQNINQIYNMAWNTRLAHFKTFDYRIYPIEYKATYYRNFSYIALRKYLNDNFSRNGAFISANDFFRIFNINVGSALEQFAAVAATLKITEFNDIKYTSKFDVYSLGVSLAEVFIRMDLHTIRDDKKLEIIKSWIQTIINPNMFERSDISEAVNSYIVARNKIRRA